MLEQKDLQAIAELIKESERTIVNELARTEDILTRRIEKIEQNLEELNQYYKITKLENDIISCFR